MIALTSGSGEDTFYDAAPLEPHLLYQGEVLVDVPLMLMPKALRWLLLRTKSGTPVDEALMKGNNPRFLQVFDANQTTMAWEEDSSDGDYAIGRLSKRPVLVVSQTCDISNKDFVAVAPINPVGDALAEKIAQASRGDIFDVYYLPANKEPWLPESFADLSQLQAVHKSYIKRLTAAQHFRLAPANVLLLQQRLTRYFGRPNSFDARVDIAPREGTYLCISCFYAEGVVSSCSLGKNAAFPTCDVCQGTQWIRRGRS